MTTPSHVAQDDGVQAGGSTANEEGTRPSYHGDGPTYANPGRGWIVVRAPELTPAALISAIGDGDFYASTGVVLDDVVVANGRVLLRIHPEDEGRYSHINDFVGKTVGAVSGMAAERDIDRRAPEGVIIRRAQSFDQLYEEFDAGELDAIAEAEYYTLDDEIIPSHGGEVILIDHHDLTPGQREESVFVVRDKSTNLLQAVNDFIARTKFPL